MSRDVGWEQIVFYCILLLLVIAFFKFLFWIAIACAIIGLVWLLAEIFSGWEISWIPAVMLIGGIVIAIISYQIGYGFEQSSFGGTLVNASKAIVGADTQIKNAQSDAAHTIISSVSNSTKS